MQLIELKTENFKKLGTGTFHFTEGVNVVLGDNAQGKTTLLRAVAVALFGPSVLPGKAEDIATWGTENWKLELTFSSAGKTYEITRSKTVSRIVEDGELVATSSTACVRFIKDLINLDAKDYNLLVHSRQGETAYALNYGATALQRKVEEFSGIHELDTIAKESRRLGRDASVKVEQSVEQLSRMRGEEEVKNDITSAEQELKELLFKINSNEQLLDTAPVPPAETVPQIYRRKSNYEVYLSELESYHTNKTEAEQQLSEAEKPTEDVGQLESEVRQLRKQLTVIKATERRIEDLTLIVGSVLTAPKEEYIETSALEEDAEKYTEELNRLSQEFKSVQSRIDTGVCPTCSTVLSQDLDSLQEQADGIQFQTLKIKELKENSVAELNSALAQNTKFRQELAQYEKDFAAKDSAHSELGKIEPTESYEDVSQRIASLSNAIESQGKIASTYARLERRVKQLKEPEAVAEVAEVEIEKLEQEWETYKAASAARELTLLHINSAKREKVNVETLKERAETELASRGRVEEEISTLSKESDTAKELTTYLTGEREKYLMQVWDSILTVASNFLSEATGNKLTGLEIEDGKFLYCKEGKLIPTTEASGAELAFIGTALRLGLNKALYRGDTFLAFDEPTEAMTEENSRSLVASLSGTAKQVIVITHKETDQGLASNLISLGS